MTSRSRWKDEEKETLISIWYSFSREAILKLLNNRTWKSIERKAEELKIERKRIEPEQSKIFPNWLIGEMIGDGHISKDGVYKHTTKYMEYAIFLKEKFEKIGIHVNLFKNDTFDKRTQKIYKRYLLGTRSNFKEYRKIWYPENKKIIPDDLILNDEVLFHLIIGDGSVGNHEGSSFMIATEGFSINSVNSLKEKLSKMGIEVSIMKNKNLYIKRNIKNKFIFKRIIDSFKIPKCYEYKINALRRWAESSSRIKK